MIRASDIRRLLAAAALLTLAAGCEHAVAPAAPAPQARPVDILQVKLVDVPVTTEFVGRTASSQRVEIRARVSGFLDEIAYTEGEFAEEGDVMFRIDPLPFESQLRAAKAELAQQQARLDNAEALLARIEPLAEVNAVAQKELDDATGQVLAAAAGVEEASARVFQAELDLGYTTISAPVRGLTSAAVQREGAYIDGFSSPLTYVARIDPMWVEFSISESQVLASIRSEREGAVRYPETMEVEIVLVDGSVHPHRGRITFADASFSEQTGTFGVRAEIPNPEETLRPGQYVRVVLIGAERPQTVVLPQRAVHEGSKGAFVWIVDAGGKAELRPIQTGPWLGDAWIIEGGVKEGDRVIVNGVVGMQPGMPLNVTSIVQEPVIPGEDDD